MKYIFIKDVTLRNLREISLALTLICFIGFITYSFITYNPVLSVIYAMGAIFNVMFFILCTWLHSTIHSIFKVVLREAGIERAK